MRKKPLTITILVVLLLAFATPCVWLAAVNRQKRLDSALFEAAADGTGEDVRRAVEAGARVEAQYEELGPVHIPIPIVRDWINPLYVEEKLDIDITPVRDPRKAYQYGWQPIHQAASRDNLGALKTLLALGSKPDATDGEGVQPIHLAAAWRSLPTTQCLLDAGADVNAADARGWQAMHYVVRAKQDGYGFRIASVDTSKTAGMLDLLRKAGVKTSRLEAERKIEAEFIASCKAAGIQVIELEDEDIEGPLDPPPKTSTPTPTKP